MHVKGSLRCLFVSSSSFEGVYGTGCRVSLVEYDVFGRAF